ncbi:MAG: PqqD family peptide modification chaperone [Proteobacteria bacterium]|nr:PqqD family peptide modification chaperone [Pseudomonadota bacterium]
MDKSSYFYRTLVYKREDDKILLIDKEKLDQTIPLDPWLGQVVSLADGQHTIEQLIDYLGHQYQETPPDNLKETIESVLDRLLESKAIALSDVPYKLPYYLAVPQEEQNQVAAMEMMVQDGFLKH